MGLQDNKNQDVDWVDRWSRKIAIVVQKIVIAGQRAWPPTRDWTKSCYEKVVTATRQAWPPTRDWIDRTFWKTVIATRRWWRLRERDQRLTDAIVAVQREKAQAQNQDHRDSITNPVGSLEDQIQGVGDAGSTQHLSGLKELNPMNQFEKFITDFRKNYRQDMAEVKAKRALRAEQVKRKQAEWEAGMAKLEKLDKHQFAAMEAAIAEKPDEAVAITTAALEAAGHPLTVEEIPATADALIPLDTGQVVRNWAIALGLLFLMFRGCSAILFGGPDTETTPAHKQLNISYAQMTKTLDDYFYIEKSTDVHGQPRYMGKSTNGVAVLEVVGDKANISQTSLMIGLPKDSMEAFAGNVIFVNIFLENAFGKNGKRVFDLLIPAMKESESDGREKIITFDNRHISVIYSESLGILTITIRAR